jgi:hypothetical protein
MERVSFLVEETGERIPCLLNPESLVVRRQSAVRRAASATGYLTGRSLGDDRLVITGGGHTELELDLLFDTSLVSISTPGAGLPVPGEPLEMPDSSDVRDLTGPLWRLAENDSSTGFGTPPLVRFVWGKTWNVLGLIARIAERLEQFGPDGGPRRSWLRLHLVRVSEPRAPAEVPSAPPQAILDAAATTSVPASPLLAPKAATPRETTVFEVVGGGAGGQRLDDIAAQVYGGRTWLWRYLATVNSVANPPWVAGGTHLQIPPPPALPDQPEAGA